MTESVRLNKILLGLADVAVYVLAFYLSFYLRYGWDLPQRNIEPFTFMLPWFVVVFLLLMIVFDLYSIYIKFDDILASLICVVVIAVVINASLSFTLRQFAVPRSIFLISSILQLLLLSLWRYQAWRRGVLIKNPRPALIIGYPGEIRKLMSSVNVSLGKGLRITREIRLNAKDNFQASWKAFLDSSSAGSIEVILVCGSVGQKERETIISYALEEGKLVMLVPRIYEILLQQAKMVSAGDMPVIQLQGVMGEGRLPMVKRTMDILFSLLALLITAPLILAISLAVKLNSPGPVFYTQERAGMKGKTFNLYKFRTMIQDAERLSGPVMTGQRDDRITGVGCFLRRTRLDELPQFINVLKGDMSLVGPRPERPHFIEEFTETLPEFDYRHQIQAGLTGLAQVEGNYTTDPVNKLRYDLYYAQKKSLFMDLVILLRTARVMLQKKKSA